MLKSYQHITPLDDFILDRVAEHFPMQTCPESTAAPLDKVYRSALSVQEELVKGRPLEAWTEIPKTIRQALLHIGISLLRIGERYLLNRDDRKLSR